MVIKVSLYLTAALTMLLAATTQPVTAETITPPHLYDDRDYNEYWEQQFLFDSGALVTSQFLIANFAFSKQHGLMVATLKEPGKDTVIVKNGRKRDGWNFDPQRPMLSIYQHQFSGIHPDFTVKLHNTAAEVEVTYHATDKMIPLTFADNTLGLPVVTLLSPTATATGRWRPGPEIGGAGPDGDWQDLGGGGGYALHVVQRKNLNSTIRRWKRFTAMAGGKGYEPVMHTFETPKGETQTILILVSKDGAPIRFDNVTLSASSTEDRWTVSATSGGNSISGTIQTTSKIEEFILKDHLNTLEQIVAGSLADIARRRFKATYDLTLSVDGTETNLTGDALAEDIILGEEKKKKRRARR